MREIHVSAGVIVRDGLVLIARRLAHDSLPGAWEFPGGTIEPGETPAACIVRELREELAVETRVRRFLGRARDDSPARVIHLYFFEMELVSGEVRIVDHDAFEWVRVEDTPRYAFAPADAPIVAEWARLGRVTPLENAGARTV